MVARVLGQKPRKNHAATLNSLIYSFLITCTPALYTYTLLFMESVVEKIYRGFSHKKVRDLVWFSVVLWFLIRALQFQQPNKA